MCIFIGSVFCANAIGSEIVLATSTSTTSSGLLEKLIPAFEKNSGHKIIVHSVGTGKALRMGRQGKVDILLTHAPEAEKKFVADGYGVLRTPLMKNDFVLVGPKKDQAHINNLSDVKLAFDKIRKSKSLFVSRADDSGTHKKEMYIWRACDVTPYGDWYYEIGASMGKTLKVTNNKDAYLLIDRGTWLAGRGKSRLTLHVEHDPLLDNPYHLIAINPERFEKINYTGTKTFINWLRGDEGREIIENLRVDGEQLYKFTEL